MKTFILSILLAALPVRGGDRPMQLLWNIGSPDNSTAEFALAPANYEGFTGPFGDPDDIFFIERSKPGEHWPYVLPGTVDAWAGSTHWGRNRMHVLPIGFQLESSEPLQSCRLTIDFADTHPVGPPLFRVWVNGHPHDFQLPKGGSDDSIKGNLAKAREFILELDIPAKELKLGYNEIVLTIQKGSWALFDAIKFEAPGPIRLKKTDTIVREMKTAPYGKAEPDGVAPVLRVDLQQFDKETTVFIEAEGWPAVSRLIPAGRTILEVPLPKVKGAKKVSIRAGGKLICEETLTFKPVQPAEPADYIDVFMGTAHSRWMIAPGPWMPFGMVKLSPENEDAHWLGGYDYAFEHINGFSHIHEWTMAGLLTMPTTGPLKTEPGTEENPTGGYSSRFDKSAESGGTGYYSVLLKDYNIKAELTATVRAGLQRYTFPKSDQARVLVDLHFPAEYNFKVEDALIRRVSDTEIEGFSVQRSPNVWYPGDEQLYTVHFVLQFSKPFDSLSGWLNTNVFNAVTEVKGSGNIGGFVSFKTEEQEAILVRSGISLVSIENAQLNLETELVKPFGWNFEAVVQNQRSTWNELLSRIEIETEDTREKARFYSNLYRTYSARNIWSDVNGQWRDPEEIVRTLADPTSPVYGCDAFWNTFWNLNQLLVLATPEIASKWVNSQLAMYDAGGWLAKGPAGMEYISVMVAEHEIPLIVAAYQAGIRGFDPAKAYAACRKMQTTLPQKLAGGGYVGNENLEPYLRMGYVPHGEKSNRPHSQEKWLVSNTLEYAYDDWTLAQFARKLGKEEDFQTFSKRAENWRNVFDKETGFMRPKLEDGTWLTPFDPYHTPGFTEGNAWQYTWFVPQNVPGLIKAMGSERFVSRLNEAMEKSKVTRFNATGERYEFFPVNHGNQPSMQVGWLFNYADAPWLSQKWVREIIDRYYGYGPQDAYLGDEDQGQMSAWFIMAAIGLFQTDGGCRSEPIYELGSPLYSKTTIRLDQRHYPGKSFTIEARNTSRENKFIQSARLNGKVLNQWWISQKDLVRGGTLELELGPEPNKQWARSVLPLN